METLREYQPLRSQRKQSRHLSKLNATTKPYFMEPKTAVGVENKRNSVNRINFRSKREFYERYKGLDDDVDTEVALVGGAHCNSNDVTPKASQASLQLHRQSTKRNSLALGMGGGSTPGRSRSLTDGGGRIVTQLYSKDSSYVDRSDSDGATPTQSKRAKNNKLQRTVDRRVRMTSLHVHTWIMTYDLRL